MTRVQIHSNLTSLMIISTSLITLSKLLCLWPFTFITKLRPVLNQWQCLFCLLTLTYCYTSLPPKYELIKSPCRFNLIGSLLLVLLLFPFHFTYFFFGFFEKKSSGLSSVPLHWILLIQKEKYRADVNENIDMKRKATNKTLNRKEAKRLK